MSRESAGEVWSRLQSAKPLAPKVVNQDLIDMGCMNEDIPPEEEEIPKAEKKKPKPKMIKKS